MLAVGYLRHFEKVDEYVYLDMHVEKIINVYISLSSSVWNNRLDDNIYFMLTWDPGLNWDTPHVLLLHVRVKVIWFIITLS